MARFVPGTAGGEAVARAGRSSPPDLAALVGVTRELETRLGLPLTVTQISSGDWLVLSVDVAALTDRSVGMLRGRESVAAVRTSAPEAGETGAPPSVRVTINFAPGSHEFKAVSDAATGAATEPLISLLAALEAELGVPLSGEPEEAGQLVLQLNLDALTRRLVEELNALPEIESAQPNYILRAFGTGGE